jgi:DNA helicase IV
MSTSDHDWRVEQQRVDWVSAKIRNRIESLEAEVGLVKSDVVDIRKHFWDEVTVNVSTLEDAAETYASMKQQAEVLSERERSHRNSVAALSKLKRLVRSPYFGRIDFREDGESRAEQIYLGIASFQDEDGETFLVYDWRAPISSLYYDYPPGPAAYETPVGFIRGEMLLKRQFMIRDGHIRLMFDTGVTIGDELLQQALSRNADAQMKSIVATIQKEQNRIIRNDRSRMLIVQGAAGSGKTSAALQRVAYLLYKNRETLQADQMVLFSPNPLFNSYVSTVLPELGEENMQQTTFQEYLEHRLGKQFQVEDPFSQLEYVLTSAGHPGYDARISGIRFKSSADFMKAIHAYAAMLGQEGMCFKALHFQGRDFADERLLATLVGAADIPELWPEICRQTVEKLERSELAYEDATPFLYLQELVLGFQSNTAVRHVFVDEAQDYTPFQLEFLKRLFPRCRMTALGDLNQAIFAHTPALQDADPLTALYGPERTELIRLTRSYRSTREIVEFTRGIVPGGEEIEPFDRSGEKPRIIMTANRDALHDRIAADIDALRADGYESIAIICKTAGESAEAFEALNERIPLHLITKHTPSFEKGTVVIPAYLAKGVEFDAVILYDGSQDKYGREQERKLFYTVCTRAMHLLHIYTLGEPSPFITAVHPETYQLLHEIEGGEL